jgi:hypothetical protein
LIITKGSQSIFSDCGHNHNTNIAILFKSKNIIFAKTKNNMETSTKSDLIKSAIIIALTAIIVCLLTCKRDKQKVTTTKKQGKTELVKSTETITFDTLKWIAYYKANPKPVIKWKKPKQEKIEIDFASFVSPCDSVFESQDTGSIEGVKYAIIDTISDNRVIGRSIKLQVPQTQITKQVFKTNDSLRVDTVYITTKQKFGTNAKWFMKGFLVGGSLGFGTGVFVTR